MALMPPSPKHSPCSPSNIQLGAEPLVTSIFNRLATVAAGFATLYATHEPNSQWCILLGEITAATWKCVGMVCPFQRRTQQAHRLPCNACYLAYWDESSAWGTGMALKDKGIARVTVGKPKALLCTTVEGKQ